MSIDGVFGKAPPGLKCRERLAAYAVIARDDGSVAVVRSRSGCFLPGGGSLPDERPAETVAREVVEELGREVRVLGQVAEAIQYFHSTDDECWYEMRATFFIAELTAEALPSRRVAIEWLDPRNEPVSFFHASHTWAVSQTKRWRARGPTTG